MSMDKRRKSTPRMRVFYFRILDCVVVQCIIRSDIVNEYKDADNDADSISDDNDAPGVFGL